MDEYIERNTRLIARLVRGGKVIPFLGAGVNAMGRTPGVRRTSAMLPSGAELAAELADYFEYPEASRDLMKVSQYVDMAVGSAELYDHLHEVFEADYVPTQLHRMLAGLPGRLRATGSPGGYVCVTTNYDDALETAFRELDEPFDLVYYIADGPERGRFAHVAPDGATRLIDRPNEYHELDPDHRPVVAKIHGAMIREDPDRDSYVITEDHYIDYLTRTDVSDLIPLQLATSLTRSHFLFLGYSLADWNLRVILHRIWTQQRLPRKSWAVQLDPDPIEQKWWERQGVELIRCRLEEYVAALEAALDCESAVAS